MTLNQAIAEAGNMMSVHNPSITLVMDEDITDPVALGNFIISAACSDEGGASYHPDASDFIWFHIANIGTPTALGKQLNLTLKYYDTSLEYFDALDAAQTLATTLNLGSLSELDAIKAVYLWIARNCAYDSSSRIGGGYQRNSMYDVLNVQKAVCQGVANTVYYMLNRFTTTKCRMVQGHELYKLGLYKHCFNVVQYNGSWYYLDATAAIHAYEDDPSITDTDLLAWCMKCGQDLQASGRTNYLVLPNHLRSEWRMNIQPMAVVSAF